MTIKIDIICWLVVGSVRRVWVSKNGLAKNWREVHPHASDLLTIH